MREYNGKRVNEVNIAPYNDNTSIDKSFVTDSQAREPIAGSRLKTIVRVSRGRLEASSTESTPPQTLMLNLLPFAVDNTCPIRIQMSWGHIWLFLREWWFINEKLMLNSKKCDRWNNIVMSRTGSLYIIFLVEIERNISHARVAETPEIGAGSTLTDSSLSACGERNRAAIWWQIDGETPGSSEKKLSTSFRWYSSDMIDAGRRDNLFTTAQSTIFFVTPEYTHVKKIFNIILIMNNLLFSYFSCQLAINMSYQICKFEW